MLRSQFVSMLCAAQASNSALAKRGQTRIVRTFVRSFDIGNGSDEFESHPFISAIAPFSTGYWAIEQWYPRLFKVTNGSLDQFDIPDGIFAGKPAAMADGSIYFTIAPQMGLPNTTPINFIGHLDTTGAYKRILLPGDGLVTALARLGRNRVVALTASQSSYSFYIIDGSRFDLIETVRDVYAQVLQIATATDGAVWYLHEKGIGRLDSYGQRLVSRIIGLESASKCEQMIALPDASMLIVTSEGEPKMCIAHVKNGSIVADFEVNSGARLCSGIADRNNHLWFYDASARLTVATIDPPKIIAVVATPISDGVIACNPFVLGIDAGHVIAVDGPDTIGRYHLVSD